MKIKLGTTGMKVNPVGFGGIPIQRLGYEESDRLLAFAVERGIQFFDTARVYTDSEAKFGRILSRHREGLVVATKSFARNRDGMIRDIEVSLKKLRLSFIDLYQCHNVSSEDILQKVLGPRGALKGLLEAREQGLIRHIGITGHKPWVIQKAIEEYPFDTIQVPLNYIETSALKELVPLAREKGIGIIAMKPVGGGAIVNRLLNYRFIFNAGADVIIPGMDQVEQINENLSVMDDTAALSPREEGVLEEEKEELGESFCRRCAYCMPCPRGLDIPFLHLLGAYYFRYRLKNWAWERLQGLEKNYDDCVSCRECLDKCPYDLDMPAIFARLSREIREDYRKIREKETGE